MSQGSEIPGLVRREVWYSDSRDAGVSKLSNNEFHPARCLHNLCCIVHDYVVPIHNCIGGMVELNCTIGCSCIATRFHTIHQPVVTQSVDMGSYAWSSHFPFLSDPYRSDPEEAKLFLFLVLAPLGPTAKTVQLFTSDASQTHIKYRFRKLTTRTIQ